MACYNGADIKRSKPNKGVDAKMEQNLIRPMTAEYEEYLRDESRSVGHGESISFPKSTQQIQAVLKQLQASGTPVTLQGSRTGLTAAAVPDGGHVMNLSRMDRVLGCRQDDQGAFYLTVQPGVLLAELRKKIRNKNFDTTGWDEASLRAYTAFCRAPEQFFTPDPTETSASLGGMVNCNASGARSLYYGSVRPYVSRLKMVLADGDTLTIRRGEHFAKERQGALRTDSGRLIQIPLPTYQMPHTKNASGYYAADDMDLIDLFIGADGTLGVTAEIEIRLVPLPPIVWGVTAFFDREEKALRYVRLIRGEVLEEGQQPFVLRPVSAEFFNGDALEILRRQKRENSAFAQIHDIPARYQAAIYVELHGEQEEEVLARLLELGRAITMAGGDEGDTWVARDQSDLDRLMFFRHAIPECVNMLIDKRKQKDKTITKLGTDMAVPDSQLEEVMALYNRMLQEQGLESAIWGHIGNNHLHVNILPNDGEEYKKGQQLYRQWAAYVTEKGGAVSAEHGVGKLKAGFLLVMYGPEHIRQMRRLKLAFDPECRLNRGNLFAAEEEAK